MESMDAKKPPASPAPKPAAPAPRLRDRLEAVAKEKPDGGRLKTLVYLALGGTVLMIAVLQMLGVLENPVAQKVREGKERRGEIPKSAPAPDGPDSPKAPEGPETPPR